MPSNRATSRTGHGSGTKPGSQQRYLQSEQAMLHASQTGRTVSRVVPLQGWRSARQLWTGGVPVRASLQVGLEILHQWSIIGLLPGHPRPPMQKQSPGLRSSRQRLETCLMGRRRTWYSEVIQSSGKTGCVGTFMMLRGSKAFIDLGNSVKNLGIHPFQARRKSRWQVLVASKAAEWVRLIMS